MFLTIKTKFLYSDIVGGLVCVLSRAGLESIQCFCQNDEPDLHLTSDPSDPHTSSALRPSVHNYISMCQSD